MFYQSIAWLFQDTDKIVNCQLFKSSKDWKTSDQFWDNPKFLNIFRNDFLHVRAGFINSFIVLTETDDFFTKTLLNNFFDPIKSPTYDKEDVLGVHLDHLLLRVFTSPLRWNTSDGSFDDLQESLLHPFTRNVTCDRDVFTFLSDLINFIDIDDATFCTLNIEIRCLKKF